MEKAPKIYFFLGTTAELIKVAPVIAELKKRKEPFKIIASNQNVLRYDQLRPIFGDVDSDYTFKLKKFTRPRNIYLRFVVWIIKSLGNYFLYFRGEFKGKNKKKILFIVHGDTVTALIGAIVAKINRVKLVHIESGLRSFNFLEPFPEEICRFVISFLADVHFCPNKWSINNLRYRRGVKVNTFGNTISESTQLSLRTKKVQKLKGLTMKKYFIFVIHRQEHILFNKSDTERIIRYITDLTTNRLKCVFIMHHLTKDYLNKNKQLFSKIKRNPNVIFPARLNYLSFVHLVRNSEFFATDGGSNQEEAYYMGKPCLILRNRTERIEGLGENAMLSKNDLKTIGNFIANYKSYIRSQKLLKKRPSKIIVDNLIMTL